MISRYLTMFFLASFVACTQEREPIVQQLMQDRIEMRIQEYRAAEKVNCRQAILEEAIATVDSILRANPINIRIDSLHRPPVPPKPSLPEFSRRKDSLTQRPLIDNDTVIVDSIKKDSLGIKN